MLVWGPVLAGGGCFHYTSAAGPDPARGTPVRLHLERPASFDLTGLTVRDVTRVDGEFVTRDPGWLILSATWLDAASGRGYPGGGWTVRVDEGQVTRFEVRRVSWLRTGLALAGVAAASYFGFEAFRGSGGGEGRSGGGSRTN